VLPRFRPKLGGDGGKKSCSEQHLRESVDELSVLSLRGAAATWQPQGCLPERVRLPRYARNDIVVKKLQLRSKAAVEKAVARQRTRPGVWPVQWQGLR